MRVRAYGAPRAARLSKRAPACVLGTTKRRKFDGGGSGSTSGGRCRIESARPQHRQTQRSATSKESASTANRSRTWQRVGSILSHAKKKPSGIFPRSRNWSTVNIRDERKKIPLAVSATTSVWVCNSRQWAVKCWRGRGRRGWGARFQPIGSWKMCIHENSFKVLISRF